MDGGLPGRLFSQMVVIQPDDVVLVLTKANGQHSNSTKFRKFVADKFKLSHAWLSANLFKHDAENQ